MQMKSAKAQADFVFSEPFVPVETPTTVSISSGAPLSHGRHCWSTFSFPSRVDIMVAQGRWASRKDADLCRLKRKENENRVTRMGRRTGGADQTLPESSFSHFANPSKMKKIIRETCPSWALVLISLALAEEGNNQALWGVCQAQTGFGRPAAPPGTVLFLFLLP